MGQLSTGWPPHFVAGLPTPAVVIPKAMAFAAIAGLPLQTGLYTALIPPVVYAAIGTSRALSVTTTSPISILVAAAGARLAPSGDSARLVETAASLALMVGCALLLAVVLRLGFLADFISAPVLTGFKAGIATVIVVGQIPKLLGIHFDTGEFLENVVRLVQHVPDTSLATLALGAALLALIVGPGTLFPGWPGPLMGGVGGS